MSLQSIIVKTLADLEASNPKAYNELSNMSPGEYHRAIYAESSSTQRGEPVFKKRPFNQNIVCYTTAEFLYVQALYLCSFISNPTKKAQCEADALDAYCDAHEACGIA